MLANNRSLFALGLVTALSAGTSAVAAPADDTLSQIVSYADLDLTTEQGAARLDQRVRAALSDVCGGSDARDLATRARVAECRKNAANDAREHVALAVATARSDTQLAQNFSAPTVSAGAR